MKIEIETEKGVPSGGQRSVSSSVTVLDQAGYAHLVGEAEDTGGDGLDQDHSALVPGFRPGIV